MRDLLLFAIAGFAASFVDGALGMGFGPTSSSILLISGLAPAVVSTSVNLAKVVTGIAAGVSHWQFRNLDRRLVLNLALPGCVGAIVGVTVLSSIDGATLRPYLAVLLTLVGVRILIRFAGSSPIPAPTATAAEDGAPLTFDRRGLTFAALLGGITNGLIGAMGPCGHAVSAASRGSTPFRDRLCQHGGDRRGFSLGVLAPCFDRHARAQRITGDRDVARRRDRCAARSVGDPLRAGETNGHCCRRAAAADQRARVDRLGRASPRWHGCRPPTLRSSRLRSSCWRREPAAARYRGASARPAVNAGRRLGGLAGGARAQWLIE